jgi:hypothetical protein
MTLHSLVENLFIITALFEGGVGCWFWRKADYFNRKNMLLATDNNYYICCSNSN